MRRNSGSAVFKLLFVLWNSSSCVSLVLRVLDVCELCRTTRCSSSRKRRRKVSPSTMSTSRKFTIIRRSMTWVHARDRLIRQSTVGPVDIKLIRKKSFQTLSNLSLRARKFIPGCLLRRDGGNGGEQLPPFQFLAVGKNVGTSYCSKIVIQKCKIRARKTSFRENLET